MLLQTRVRHAAGPISSWAAERDPVAQLKVFRKGWTNEHLSAFLLSKVAFVASPTKIGDDIGADFLCTLFRTVVEPPALEWLIPTSSFAIQIKSSGSAVDVSKQIDALMELEIPFLVGMASETTSSLKIYSAEFLPILRAARGRPERLRLCLEEHRPPTVENCYTDRGRLGFDLWCPLVCELAATTDAQELSESAKKLRDVVVRAQSYLVSLAADDYFFELVLAAPSSVMFAGPRSVEVFWSKLYQLLAQAFFNFKQLGTSSRADAEIFFEFLEDLENASVSPPPLVKRHAAALRDALNRTE